MSATERFTAEFVDSFPKPMLPGVLYVSAKYSTAGHMCPCGCGGEVVTKLSPARYKVIFDGEVTLKPSIAAVGLQCNSHYFITRGEVDWHSKLNVNEESRARAADQRAVQKERAAARSVGPFGRLLERVRWLMGRQ